tara:strand:+ start:378 stop:2390 length:2013 start_codon:yes stop_codon:yes gene_type:complete
MSKYSDFWFDNRKTTLVDDILSTDDDKPVKKGKDLIGLAGHKRAISNFVRIVSGQNIPVNFMTRGDSYTDGKSVTIGSNINEKNFDHVVGLALHEGSHIAYSDFNAFRDARQLTKVRNFDMTSERSEFFRGMINYIEDRRVDSLVFKSSPGYKGYYHSLYEKYFNGKKVAKGLGSTMYRELDFESYMFRIINFTNGGTELNALPRLADIYRLIDMKNILRLKSTDDAIELAKSVSEIIFGLIDESEGKGEGQNQNQNGQDEENTDSEGSPSEDNNDSSSDGEESSDDGSQTSDSAPSNSDEESEESEGEELSERQQKQIKKMFEDQKEMLDGKTKKTKLTKKDQSVVSALSNSNTEMVDTGNTEIGSVKTVVIPSLTAELIESKAFPFFRSLDSNSYEYTAAWGGGKQMIEAIANGFRLGAILGKKLKVRGEEKDLIFTRQNTGKINKRLISELGFGNDSVFSQIQKESFNKANLHISIDGSGSMNGEKFQKAVTSAVAMCKAADMAGNIHVVVDVRYTFNDNPVVVVVYNSKKDKLTKIKSLWKTLRVSGTTPESLCYEAIMKKFLGCVNGEDNYFINYSDGSPWFSAGSRNNREVYYGGERAVRHARKMVKMMKNNGMKIMSYFISGGYMSDSERDTFTKMYGKDASFIDPTNMMNVAKSMNKKFLEK